MFLADLHALTVAHEPRTLRETTLRQATVLLAAGLDPTARWFRTYSRRFPTTPNSTTCWNARRRTARRIE